MRSIDELIQSLYGMSDAQLLREFDEIEVEVENEGGPQPDSEGLRGCGRN